MVHALRGRSMKLGGVLLNYCESGARERLRDHSGFRLSSFLMLGHVAKLKVALGVWFGDKVDWGEVALGKD